jgi:hypothetical protein
MNQSKQCGAMNLYFVSILMMLVTLAALAFLYFIRYGQLPMQDVWQRWGKSAAVITQELKQASGVVPEITASTKAATVDAGIRRCTIKGKVIFSDVECSDDNPTTRAVKLYDSKGGEPPKVVAPPKDSEAGAEAELDLKKQIMEKALR